MKIQLTVPKPDEFAIPTTLTKPAEAKQWVQELPYANPMSTARQLFKMLWQINRHPELIPSRIELLTLMLHPYFELSGIEQHQFPTTFCQSRSSAQSPLGVLIKKITLEFAFGFKLFLNEISNKARKNPSEQVCAYAIRQTMLMLSYNLLLDYSIYIETSSIAWREISILYTVARKKGLEALNVEIREETAHQPKSIDQTFRQITLILILDPYRLNSHEIEDAWRYLLQYAMQAQLHPFTLMPTQPAGSFLIKADGSAKPRKLSEESQPQRGDDDLDYLLQLSALNAQINSHLNALNEDENPEIPGCCDECTPERARQLFRHMLTAWHVAPSRRHPRHEKYGAVTATLGLTSIHRYLGQQQRGEPMPEVITDDDTEEIYEITASAYIAGVTSEEQRQIHCQQVNQGQSGICLELTNKTPAEIEVGELVLMESDQVSGERWQLGVIRRQLFHISGKRLELGVQFLPGIMQSALMLDGTGKSSREGPAILIQRGSNLKDILITLPGHHQQGSAFAVSPLVAEERLVTSGRLVESTPYFERFEISDLNS